MPSYTWQEISKHVEQEDCWIVVQGKVFDVTSFLKSHPGGRWIILKSAGQDATAAF
jgi:cytochrome b involved in lipid metabolism